MTPPGKTVCVFAPTASGGHARYAWELTSALARHARGDWRFELVGTSDLDAAFRDAPYPVHCVLPPLRQRWQFRTRAGWALNRALYYPLRERRFLKWLAGRPDVTAVHLQEWKPWLATWLLQRIRATGRRAFYTVHNVLPHRYPAAVPRRLMEHWIRRACLHCDGLFVHTRRLADELVAFLGEPRPPITVVPHGVWTVPDADRAPPVAQRLRARRLLFFGAIRRNKGLDLLLRAAARLPGYRITVAGEVVDPSYFRDEVMPLLRSLRQAGTEVDVYDRFIPDDQVGELFKSHSAVVLPYTRQFIAQSGVVFMALAYGLPVVASTAGGLPDLLGECRAGETFEAGSADGLASTVRRLHEEADADALEREICAAQRRLTWQAAAAATVAGYATAWELSRAPAPETHDCTLGTTAAH